MLFAVLVRGVGYGIDNDRLWLVTWCWTIGHRRIIQWKKRREKKKAKADWKE